MSSIRLPAEWEPQSAIWLAWPRNRDTWPGTTWPGTTWPGTTDVRTTDPRNFAAGAAETRVSGIRFHRRPRFDSIPPFFARWARLIAEDTPVRILGRPTDAESRRLRSPRIEWIDIDTNDCWIRDYGPTFLVAQDRFEPVRRRAVDWRYNAWGGKYPPWDEDDAAAAKMCRHADIPLVREDLCLEGGALETDGSGRLLTTETCLVTPTRNPGITRDEIERRLRERLGVDEVVWLRGELDGDDTDGHIDQLARFVDPANVVVATSHDNDDANAKPLRDLYRQLRQWALVTEPRVKLHRLPLPPPRRIDGRRVPESYCNFLWLGRKRLLVPTFGHPPTDDRALGILRDLAQGTEIVAIDCRDMVWGLGALHCASREEPAGPS